jgi:ABC-2 type transport system permease protein
LRVLLSYPYSRRELVLGTLAGRIIVLAAAVVVGILTGVLASVVFGGELTGDLVPVAGLSLLLTSVIVAIAVGISSSVASSTTAAITAFGAYILFSTFWNFVPTAVRYVLNGFSFPIGAQPEWVFVWNQLNPLNAFRTAASAITGSPLSANFYHAIWFAILVLVGWFVLSTVIGVLRFERADL